ncbi:hypothetical protein BD414DRAFT_508493 [Trametes punicea]|nr:hypothetical protein BD414DRAFT_508493 [Trametes punicea]
MTSRNATNTAPAGLGLSFDTISINSTFFSGEETFDSLFSLSSHSHESRTDASPSRSPVEAADHWHVTYAPEEPRPDVGHFEPYLTIPRVSDFVPWPTSPDVAADLRDTRTSPGRERSPPLTPSVERGYEADADSPRAQRRQRRREAHKAPRRQRVHYLVEHVRPIIEDLPSLEEIQRRIAAYSLPQQQLQSEQTPDGEGVAQTQVGLGLGLPDLNEAARITNGSELAIEEETQASPVLLEQDITESTHGYESDADSGCYHREAYDSDDSDVDHYYDESHMDEYEYDPSDQRVHYLVQHVQPIVEDLPSLAEIQARVDVVPAEVPSTVGLGLGLPAYDEEPRVAEELQTPCSPSPDVASRPESTTQQPSANLHVGLGFMLDHPPPAPMPRHYDGFETIDLTDDAPAPTSAVHTHDVPDSPNLRPHPAEESPSPIVLASPMPVAAFRRFDDILHHNPWEDTPSVSGSVMQYAARHPVAADFEPED